jgi:hypothetical protein
MSGLPPSGPQDEPSAPEPEREPDPDPESATPWRQQPKPEPGGGSLLLGILAGVLFFAALAGLNILVVQFVPWSLISVPVLLIAYLVAAAILSGRPRTARLGSGLLIGFGVSLLLGAGVCVALISGIGRSP